MRSRQRIEAIPGALRLTLEKAGQEYGSSVREFRWGDGPIYVCPIGKCAGIGWAAGYAFEAFLGRPVVARPAEVFHNYGHSLLEAGAVLLMIASGSDAPEVTEFAQAVRRRGVKLMLLTNVPDSSLAKAADQIVLIRAEGDGDVPAVTVCLHAALNYLALTAARILKRHDPSWESLEQEIFSLPGRIEWTLTQFPALIGSLTAELTRTSRLRIVGAGFYHYPAWQGARRFECLTGLSVEGVEVSEFLSGQAGLTQRDDAVLYVSGSRSKLKKLVHRSASQARVAGARVLSITDGNDRDLAERSDLGILLPTLMEAAGSTLSLCLMEWLAGEAARAGKPAEPTRLPSH